LKKANRDVVLIGGTVNNQATLELYDLASSLVSYGANMVLNGSWNLTQTTINKFNKRKSRFTKNRAAFSNLRRNRAAGATIPGPGSDYSFIYQHNFDDLDGHH
jgi:hypothetical protein